MIYYGIMIKRIQLKGYKNAGRHWNLYTYGWMMMIEYDMAGTVKPTSEASAYKEMPVYKVIVA